MMSGTEARDPSPCLARRCGHGPADHVLTPELAGPAEVVVWCTKCRRHETHRHPRWPSFLGHSSPSRVRARLGRGS